MAYRTAAQAKSYFDLRAIAPVGWDGLTDPQIGVYLEQASVRFDSLPWPSAFETEAQRVASDVVLGAFYEYVRALVEFRGTPPAGQRDREDADPAFASFYDLPDAVFARLTTVFPEVSGIAAARQATATTTVGGQIVQFDPAQETASQAAARFAEAELLKAQAGEVFTEQEQQTQRPMRPMAISDGTATADTTAPGAGGLDPEAVERVVDQVVPAWARDESTPIPASKLTNASATSSGLTATERGWLDRAVQADDDGINLDEREIVFTGADDTSEKRIEIPGVTIEDEGDISGSASSVETLNFVGAGVRVTQDAPNKRSVHISGSAAAGAGLSTGQVEALISANESVQSHEQFENAMRRETVLAAAVSITIAADQVNLAQRIPGFPVVPMAGEDREFLIRVGTGLHRRFDNGVLLAKASATTPTLLNDSNSVAYTESDVVYRIGHRTATREFVFSASVQGTYIVTITDSQIDLKPPARRSSTQKWGLPDLDTTALDARYSGAAEPDHGYQQPVDVAATINVAAQNRHGGPNYGGNTDSGNITFTITNTVYTVRRMQGDNDNGGFSIRLSTGGTALLEDEKIKLEGYHLRMNDGSILAFSRTRRSSDDTGAGVSEYEWPSATAMAIRVGFNNIQIFENLSKRNFVPDGTADDNDSVLTRTPDGPVWRGLGRASLEPLFASQNGTGITVNAANNTGPVNDLDLVDAKYDLDNTNLTGIIEVEATLFFSTRSNTQFSFSPDEVVTLKRITGFVSLSTLRAATLWVRGSTNGPEIGRWDVWNGSSDRVGRVIMRIGRQSDGRFGPFLHYVTNAGSTTGGNFSTSHTRRLTLVHNDVPPATEEGGRGRLICEGAIPAGVHAANTLVRVVWSIMDPFGGSGNNQFVGGSDGTLTMPVLLPLVDAGFVAETEVNNAVVQRSWIPASALQPTGRRQDTGGNFSVYFKLSFTPYGPTPNNQVRAINAEYQRQLSGRHRDALRLYGAGGIALLANTKLKLYEWLAAPRGPKGEQGDQGEAGITVMIDGVVQRGVRTINFRTS